MAIEKEVLDQLLAGRDPGEVFAKDGLLDELKKALSERILNAELDDHLATESEEGSGGKVHPLVLPAYDCVLRCSHTFNVLDARGALSVTERANLVRRIRRLACRCAEQWVRLHGGRP